MVKEILSFILLILAALVVWHHIGWPVFLKAIARPALSPQPLEISELPAFTLVMPACNESGHIKEKMFNIAKLYYPRSLLHVVIVCDGCSDGTAEVARAALDGQEFSGISVEIRDLRPNRGKVAVLNEALARVESELVALTDVSAMLPADALLLAAAHYADPSVGAVGGTYRLGVPGASGETTYWRYQIALKRGEAALGAPLGMHGAFWTFRRSAWEALAPDTINDDFVMPMSMLRRGWKLRYDERIVAVEAEESDEAQDARRRRRIASGNAQQLYRLRWLLNPRFGGIALSFASGKALRVTMPFLLVTVLIGSLALASGSVLFASAAALQIAGYAAAAAGMAIGPQAPKLFAVARYAVSGHIMSGVGVIRYILGKEKKPWGRMVAARAGGRT